jgi:CTP synthase
VPEVKRPIKYIFVVGGVVSGLGKGIVCASIGLLLKSCSFKVNHVKIDPYFNVDAGTMRPAEHGEVFVTNDGGEIDQDLGNYERFLNQDLSRENNITSGKVYLSVITGEREFKYEGRDVEMIPDIPNEVKRRFIEIEKGFDFVIVEIGGTTGDIENLPFLYAAREMGRERKSMYVLVSYVPFLRNVGELKTKPTQHAVSMLRSTGINPDMLVTRGEMALDQPRLETLAKRCFLDDDAIFDDPDSDNVYRIPDILNNQGITKKIFKHFDIKNVKPELSEWDGFVKNIDSPKKEIAIALVGKYVKHGGSNHRDVYVSVLEAVRHAGAKMGCRIKIVPFESTNFGKKDAEEFENNNIVGVIVPQGWGSRGTEGKVEAIKFARENKIPYLGLCFGMQMAVVEFSRNVCGLRGANSVEVDSSTKYPVVDVMPDQKKYLELHQYGGTIRLGSWECRVTPNTLLEMAYKEYGMEPNLLVNGIIKERHRHRYEVNNKYRDILVKSGLVISGTSPDGLLVEAIELPKKLHPFFVGTQFHPEYKSRPLSPHPLFVKFIESCLKV